MLETNGRLAKTASSRCRGAPEPDRSVPPADVSTRRTPGAAVTLVSPNRRYPLELDQTEIERYRTMAEAARQAEADLWERAGIVAGAQVADVGCGPGAMLPALADTAGPDGRVTAVDADRRRGRPGRRWSQLAWRPPRISGVGTRPSRQQRGARRPSSSRCSPPSAAVRPFDRPISTCAPEASSSPPQPHPIRHSPTPTTPTPDFHPQGRSLSVNLRHGGSRLRRA